METVEPTAAMEKLGFTKRDSYTCTCPLYLFDELVFVRDNSISIENLHDKDKLYMWFRNKKRWIDDALSRCKLIDHSPDVGRSLFDQEIQKANVVRTWTDNAKNIHKNIWGMLYAARRENEQVS